MMVHEWLRGNFQDARIIREVNKLFHSKDFFQASSKIAHVMLRQVSGDDVLSRTSPPKRRVYQMEIPVDMSKIQLSTLQSTIGLPLEVDLVCHLGYGDVVMQYCDVRPTNSGPPLGGASGRCDSKLSLNVGESVWVSEFVQNGGMTKAFELARVVGGEPDFTFP
jgi:hypothetical protein